MLTIPITEADPGGGLEKEEKTQQICKQAQAKLWKKKCWVVRDESPLMLKATQ